MKCPKCELEMFSRPIVQDGKVIQNFECKNRQCELYKPDKNAENTAPAEGEKT